MRVAFDEASGRRVFTQIGAALLLGHRIADDRRTLGLDGKAPRIVIRRQRSLPPRRKLRLAGKSGDRGVSHPGGATDAVLDLIPEITQRRARKMSIWLAGRPGQAMDLALERQRHQLMPGRMKLDPIIAVAIPVMGHKFRFVLVGQSRGLLHGFAAGVGSERGKLVLRPRRDLCDQAAQRPIAIERVEAEGRPRLIADFVGRNRIGFRIRDGNRLGSRVHAETFDTSVNSGVARRNSMRAESPAIACAIAFAASESGAASGARGPTKASIKAPVTQDAATFASIWTNSPLAMPRRTSLAI